MSAWRARIGLIVPSSNTTMEPEMWRMSPRGVTIHTGRVRLERVTIDELEIMERFSEDEAKKLATAEVDIIVFGCTTGSLIKGPGYDKKISMMLSKASGVPAITTATAVVEALKSLGAKKIGLATPYTDVVSKREEEFLVHHGFEIVDHKYLGLSKNVDIGRTSPATVYRLVKKLNTVGAEAIFISCTNLRTLEIIKPLEKDLGIPVISSNTATMWLTLKTLRIKPPSRCPGMLFKT